MDHGRRTADRGMTPLIMSSAREQQYCYEDRHSFSLFSLPVLPTGLIFTGKVEEREE